MVVRIAGKRMYLWRAVDHEGEVFDMLVQPRRDSRAALRLMRTVLKKQGFAPKLLVTDKLRAYASAFRRQIAETVFAYVVGSTQHAVTTLMRRVHADVEAAISPDNSREISEASTFSNAREVIMTMSEYEERFRP